MSNLVFDPSKLVISREESIGVIAVEMNALKCLICKSNSCEHVAHVNGMDSGDQTSPVCITEFMEKISTPKAKRIPSVISKAKVEFYLSEASKISLSLPPDQRLEKLNVAGEEKLYLKCDGFSQDCVGEEHIIDENDNTCLKSIKLYTMNRIYDCVCKLKIRCFCL